MHLRCKLARFNTPLCRASRPCFGDREGRVGLQGNPATALGDPSHVREGGVNADTAYDRLLPHCLLDARSITRTIVNGGRILDAGIKRLSPSSRSTWLSAVSNSRPAHPARDAAPTSPRGDAHGDGGGAKTTGDAQGSSSGQSSAQYSTSPSTIVMRTRRSRSASR